MCVLLYSCAVEYGQLLVGVKIVVPQAKIKSNNILSTAVGVQPKLSESLYRRGKRHTFHC